MRTRNGWEELVASIGIPDSAIWVENQVLDDSELIELRQSGTNITSFTTEKGLEPDITTVLMHHPGEVIWVEA